jgi:hypothetical protein
MTPTIVTKDGKLALVIGTPGEAAFRTGVLQVMTNMIDYGMTLTEAIEAPRIHQQWPDVTYYERFGLSPDTLAIPRRARAQDGRTSPRQPYRRHRGRRSAHRRGNPAARRRRRRGHPARPPLRRDRPAPADGIGRRLLIFCAIVRGQPISGHPHGADTRDRVRYRDGNAAASSDAVLRQQEPCVLAPAILGWGGAMVLRAMSSLANAVPWSFLVIVIIATITGFSISLILSVIYRALINRNALVTWGVTAIALAVAVGLYAFIDSWVVSLTDQCGIELCAALPRGLLPRSDAARAWSALYYAINFYIQVEEQNDQLLHLENQATSAQLAMLRYQLNPHFLFNTLNSISTLVLLKQTEPANAMLSRLSSFLRYTLINEPTAQ